jgi:hypothetical protein
MDSLIREEGLLEWLGYSRRSDAMKWLDEHGVPYWYGRGGRICTTQAAIDTVMTAIATHEAKSRKKRYESIEFA